MMSYYGPDHSSESWWNTLSTAPGCFAVRVSYGCHRTLRQLREDYQKYLEEHRPRNEPRFLEKHPPQTAKVIPRKWGPKAREQRDRRKQ